MKICKIKSLVRKVKHGFNGYINVSEQIECTRRSRRCFSENSKVTALTRSDALLDCKPLVQDVINRTDRKEILFINETGLVLN